MKLSNLPAPEASSPAPAGTSGRIAAQPTAAAGAVSGAGGQFTLTNARPVDGAPAGDTSAPRGGVGANGAGGSGGPLVSGVSTFLLSGSRPELQARVNQQVRIIGTIDARETIADAARPANRAGTGAPAGSARPATPAARQVVVESIEMVAATCAN